jgi:hypothetical protein
MDQPEKKTIRGEEAMATTNNGGRQSKNGNTGHAASANAAKPAAISQWLEETPHQEYWNTVARVNESKPENMSKK